MLLSGRFEEGIVQTTGIDDGRRRETRGVMKRLYMSTAT